MPYAFLEHTADVRMQVIAKTLEELFRDALLGMVSVMKPAELQKMKSIQREIIIDADDATALLIDFLNDALVWMHTEREVYTQVRFEKLTEQSLKVELVGFRAETFDEDIKAVTYHEADVKKGADDTWRTNIIFDI